MRRSDFNKKINRNNDFVYNRNTDSACWSNTVGPSFILLDTEEVTTSGVQIVEIKSDGSETSDPDDRGIRMDTGWSYDSHEQSRARQENIGVNELAREMRRIKLETDSTTNDFYRNPQDEYDCVYHNYHSDYCNGDYYSGQTKEMPDNVFINHQLNCFTIIDKNITDSSDEDYANIEAGNSEINTSEQWNGPEQYDEDITTFFPESQEPPRTVWIYSYKNKRLLSEDDYEIVNIPSNVSFASSIDESENVEQKVKNPRRAASPIPPISALLSRMNLGATATLPTVAEVTEPKALSSDSNPKDNTLPKKPINSWFLSEHGTPRTQIGSQKPKSVVNWMALSPRGNRRTIKNTCYKNNPTLDCYKKQNKNALRNKIRPSNKIHPLPVTFDQSSQTVELCNFQANYVTETPKASNRKGVCSDRASVGVSCNLPSSQSTSDDFSPHDRGDHSRPRRRIPDKLKIRFSPKSLAGSFISGPMENLDSGDWIGEDKAIQTTLLTAQELQRYQDQELDIPPKLLIRNMSLFKPAEWTEYLPIAESVPSLQLSLNTDSLDEPVPWYTRLRRVMCKCCVVCK